MSLKKWAGNLAVLLITLLFCVGAAEVLLRLTNIQPMGPVKLAKLHQESSVPGLVYELLPNLKDQPGYGNERVSTNSLGFRGEEIDLQKPIIAMIGDSYTMGFGVGDQQSNPYELSHEFPEYSVLNAGVNGYNIEQETLQYEAKIAKLNPKLVVLQFVFNDVSPKGHFNEEGFIVTGPPAGTGAALETGTGDVLTAPGLLKIPGKRWLHEHSALFRFIERKTKWLPFRQHASLFGAEWNKAELASYEQWFDRLDENIGERKKLFVIWPEVWAHLDTRYAIETMARNRGWVVLDLYDFYGNHYESLGWDFHPTAKMHAKVAALMGEAIRHYKLLP